jgi:hypothetical protein
VCQARRDCHGQFHVHTIEALQNSKLRAFKGTIAISIYNEFVSCVKKLFEDHKEFFLRASPQTPVVAWRSMRSEPSISGNVLHYSSFAIPFNNTGKKELIATINMTAFAG